MNVGAVEMNSAISVGQMGGPDPRQRPEIVPMRQSSSGDEAPNQLEMKKVVEKMQEQIDSMNVSLQYSTYGDHGEKIAVAVVNKETGKLIREIPPKELRDLYAKMSELAGMLFNREI